MPLEVHPVADLFPMLADDELQELAEDIELRGLLQPIVLDADGRVLDGRNRLAACEIAGVEARFETYGGDDPEGFALAANGLRRSQTKTQKAIVAARYLLSKQDQDGAAAKAARALGVSPALISQAKVVTAYALDLAERILASPNGSGFAQAREVAAQRQAEAERVKAHTTRLRIDAPDLLGLVTEERVNLDDAITLLDAREEKARQDAAAREERERREAALAVRVEKLPADLAERVMQETLGIDEAESIVKQRADRLAAWAEKIRTGLETITRMVGNPMPADLKDLLTDEENTTLAAVIGALENGELR